MKIKWYVILNVWNPTWQINVTREDFGWNVHACSPGPLTDGATVFARLKHVIEVIVLAKIMKSFIAK